MNSGKFERQYLAALLARVRKIGPGLLVMLLGWQLLGGWVGWEPTPLAQAQTNTPPNQFDLLLLIDESGSMWRDQANDAPPPPRTINGQLVYDYANVRRIKSSDNLIEFLHLEGQKLTRVGVLLFSDDVSYVTPQSWKTNPDKNNLAPAFKSINNQQSLDNLTCSSPIFTDLGDTTERQALIDALNAAHSDYAKPERSSWTDTKRALQVAKSVFSSESCRPNGSQRTKVMAVLTDGVPETQAFPSKSGTNLNPNWQKNYLPQVWSEFDNITAGKDTTNSVSLFTILVTGEGITNKNLGLPDTASNPWKEAVNKSHDPIPGSTNPCPNRYLFVPTANEIPIVFNIMSACLSGKAYQPPINVGKGQQKKYFFESNYSEVTLIINKQDPNTKVTIYRPLSDGGTATADPNAEVKPNDLVLFQSGNIPSLKQDYETYRFIKKNNVDGKYPWVGNWLVTVDNTADISFTPLLSKTGYTFNLLNPASDIKDWSAARPMPLQVGIVQQDDQQPAGSGKVAQNVVAKLVKTNGAGGAVDSSFSPITTNLTPNDSSYNTDPAKPLAIPKDANGYYNVEITGTLDNQPLTLTHAYNIAPAKWLQFLTPTSNSSLGADKLHVQVQLFYGDKQQPSGMSLSSGDVVNASLLPVDSNGKVGTAAPKSCKAATNGKDFDCDFVALTQPVTPGNYVVRAGLYTNGKLTELSEVDLPLNVTAAPLPPTVVEPPSTVAPVGTTQVSLNPIVPPTTTVAPLPATTIVVQPIPVDPPATTNDLSWLLWLLLFLVVAGIMLFVVLFVLPRRNTLNGLYYSSTVTGRTPLKGRSYNLKMRFQTDQLSTADQAGPTLVISAVTTKPKAVKYQLQPGPAMPPVLLNGAPLGPGGSTSSGERETVVQVGDFTTYTITNPNGKASLNNNIGNPNPYAATEPIGNGAGTFFNSSNRGGNQPNAPATPQQTFFGGANNQPPPNGNGQTNAGSPTNQAGSNFQPGSNNRPANNAGSWADTEPTNNQTSAAPEDFFKSKQP